MQVERKQKVLEPNALSSGENSEDEDILFIPRERKKKYLEDLQGMI